MALGKVSARHRKTSVPKIQITAMMDMFTILMIFLLVSFSTKPENTKLDHTLELPESASKQEYSDSLKLFLTTTALKVGDQTLAALDGDEIVGLDGDVEFLKNSELYKALKAHREKADQEALEQQAAGEGEGDEKSRAEKHVLFFCDKKLPFKTVNQVMKVASMAGYPNMQFAVLLKK